MINAAAKYYFIENWYLAADVIPSKFLARLFYLPLFGQEWHGLLRYIQLSTGELQNQFWSLLGMFDL